MTNYTIEGFKNWDKVIDYKSDFTSVTLIGKNGKHIAEFNYPQFTRADFERLKSKAKGNANN